ncbi:MAG: YdcF family protein [Reyranella sp.]|uniref:SanA/YdcF family protein n=1 Tax=Reyranella sp. TaxID=1929291 RepID=UPI001AD0ED64|nr:ElyC/SanA/YdcF family protein [Reyranella sp.]MBN9087601.1 YdcF family protein [Reyranella sp.]
MKLLHFLGIGAAAVALAIASLLTLGAMAWTALDAWGRAYELDAPQAWPRVDAVLVLGTSPYGKRGQDQWTLSYRMDTTAGLWHSGAADRFIVSGNRIDDDYDEPAAMRDELVARGVPAKAITLDPLGRRTWDSIRRARDVYGKRRLLIVSQRVHLARAIFLARHFGIEAWGVAARGTDRDGWYEATMRNLASLLAYYDVTVRLER